MNTNHNHHSNGTHTKNNHHRVVADAAPAEMTATAASPGWSGPVVAKLQGIAKDLALAPALPMKERRSLLWTLSVPPALAPACLAVVGKFPALLGGVFDSAGVSRAIADGAEYEAAAIEARSLAVHLEDEVMRRRAKAGGDAWAFLQTLRSIARTGQGAVLQDAVTTLRTLVRGWKGRGTKRAAKAPPAPAPVAGMAPTVAHVAPPAPAPAVCPTG